MDPANVIMIRSNLTSEYMNAIKEIKRWPEEYHVIISEADKSEAYVTMLKELHNRLTLEHFYI